MSFTFNTSVIETIIIFIGVQFAGYAMSRTIDEIKMENNYRLIILWMITLVILIPVSFIKRKHTKLSERQMSQMATKIATETSMHIYRHIKDTDILHHTEEEYKNNNTSDEHDRLM
jgi:ABC-type transport system involved in cytochrome bd biosynthesis fused ATPase/permease subunit